MIIFYENVLITGFVHDNLKRGGGVKKRIKSNIVGEGGGGGDHISDQ